MVEDARGLARAPYPFTLPSGHAPAGTGLPTSIVFAISQASCRMFRFLKHMQARSFGAATEVMNALSEVTL